MRTFVKKIFASILTIAFLFSSLSTEGFNIPGVEVLDVHAAVEQSDIDYLDAQHARALIGFVYDVPKLTDDMLNAGNMYKFITGQLKSGSVEEISARIAFLTAAKANISQCMTKYDTVVDNSYEQLLETLTEIAGGDIDDGMANGVLDDVADSVGKIFLTLNKSVEEVEDVILTVKQSYSSVASIPEKIKKMKQAMEVGLSSFFHVWGSNRSNMYKYVSAYVSNRPMKDSCPSAFDATMSYNIFALNQGSFIYDPILNWSSKDHLEILNTFGDFIYQVQKSLVSYVSYSQTYKTYEVHCPTDVYLYEENGNLALSIVNNKISIFKEGLYAAEYDSQKTITTPSNQNYRLEIKGTGTGTMDYAIYEYSAGSMVRFVEFNDLPVENNTVYVSVLPQEIYAKKEDYNLVNEHNEVFAADVDSLPDVSSDIADVVVAEELFKGFSKELIDLMADSLFNMKQSVNLKDYGVSVDDAVALFSAVAKYYPSEYSLIANGDFTYQIIYQSQNEVITEMRFDYGADADLDKFKMRVASLKEKISSIVSSMESMDDFEKALYVHDYIILNCEYDLELMELLEANGKLNGELRSERYTEYSVLVNQTGICGSYALAYRAILNAAGMECVYVSSSQMNHAWNMVKVDGKWYHVDCCWDDPMPDVSGRALRTYFLRTDSEMMNMNHYSWLPTNHKAVSEKYSELPRNNDAVMKYDDVNDCWYMISGSNLIRMKKDGSDQKIVMSDFESNAIECDQGVLYLIEDQFIYELNLDNQTKQPVYYFSPYEAGAEPDQAYIRNAVIQGNQITLYQSIMEYVQSGDEYVLEPAIKRTEDTLQKEMLASVTGIIVEGMPSEMNLFDMAYPYATLTSTGEYDVWNLVIEWESSDENIVQVDQYGTLQAMNAGSAVITASFMDFEVSSTITVKGNDENPSGTAGNNISWTLDTSTGTLKLTGSGAMSQYTYGTAPWYPYISSIRQIEIGENITSIGRYAFAYADFLTSVNLPSTLTSIGDDAFLFCTKLTDIEIPSGVAAIGSSAFYTCISLKEITLPSGLTTLGRSAFHGCSSLESINIPSGITKIIEYTFEYCSSLKSIDLSGITYIERDAFSNCTSLSELVIPSSVSIISQGAFRDCRNLKTVKVEGSNLRFLSSSVFDGCSKLESVQLPNSIDSLSSSLFRGCISLENIVIPSSVKSLENNLFNNCSSLKQIVIPASVTSISNESTFSGCSSLEEFVVDENNTVYTTVDGILFNKDKSTLIAYPAGKSETEYEVPNGVKTIDWNAFYGSQALEKLVLSDTVTFIGGNAIAQIKNLTSVVLSQKLETISGGAFAGCTSLKQMDLPASLKNLERSAFYDCTSLISITIPDSVELIDQWTFQNCKSLRSVQLPKNLKTIDYSAFTGCTQLAHVAYPKSKSEFEQIDVYVSGNELLLNAEYFHYDFNPTEDLIQTEALNPTCTEEGHTESVYCQDCEYYLMGEVILASGHDYQKTEHFEGNCTESPYDIYVCLNCDDSMTKYGNPRNGHQYETTFIDPTCTQKGYTLEKCTLCDESSVTDFVSPKGHQLSVEQSDTYCPNHGTYQYQCSNCDYSEHVSVSSDNLKIETVTVEATCTQSGLIKEICDLCKATISSQIIRPLGHSFEEQWTIDKEADCKETGLKSKHCTQCDAKKELTVIEISSDKHKEPVLVNQVEATCTSSGYSGDLMCTHCEKIIEEGEVLKTLEHISEMKSGQAATCTEDGWENYYECKCGTLFADKEGTKIIESLEIWKNDEGKIPAAHDFDLTKWNQGDENGHWHDCIRCDAHDDIESHVPNLSSATETEDQKCTKCGYVMASATGHDHRNHLTHVEKKASTCTEDGNTEYYQCDCGLYFEDEHAEKEITDKQSVVIKAEHEYGTLIPAETEVHTAEELKAAVASHYICTECGDYFTELKEKTTLEELTKQAPVHVFEIEYGYMEEDGHAKTCRCGLHSDIESHVPNLPSATETEDQKCTKCGYVMASATGHDHRNHLTHVEKKASTCTEDGNTEYYQCDCGLYFEDEHAEKEITDKQSVVIKAEHEYGTLIPAETEVHTAEELKAAVASHYICMECGDYFTELKEKTTLEELTKQAPVHVFEIEYGYMKEDGHAKTCRCGLHSDIEFHVPNLLSATETEDQKCTKCGYVMASATGHDHRNHLIHVEKKASTCTEDGNTEYYQCDCGLYFEDEHAEKEITDKQSVVIKAEHEYGTLIPAETEVHTAEELKAAVASHYICTECGDYFTELKEKTTLEELTKQAPVHVYGNFVNTDPEQHWKECSCGFKIVENHVYSDEEDGACDVCGYERMSHEHIFSNELSYDGHSHWYAAICGHDVVTGKEGHHGGSSSCVHQAVCDDCGQPYGEFDYHIYGEWSGFDAYQHWKECSCGLKAQENHVYTSKKDTECDVCGYLRTIVHEHNYMHDVILPTCTEEGYTIYTCECSDSYVSDKVDSIGHLFTKYESDQNASCQHNGTKTAECDYGCGTTDTIIEEGSASEHVYVEGKCTACGDIDREFVVQDNKGIPAAVIVGMISAGLILILAAVKFIMKFMKSVRG